MLLRSGESALEVNVTSQTQETSRHTGRNLSVIEAKLIVVGEQAHVDTREWLRSGKRNGLEEVNNEGRPVRGFALGNDSFMYSGSEITDHTRFEHTFTLKEKEVLMPTSLIVSGRAFKPYRYDERFDDEALVITARVRLTKEEVNDLLAIMEGDIYFDVVREGISEKTSRMRFAMCPWSEDAGGHKVELLLVEEKYDEVHEPNVIARNTTNAHRLLVDTTDRLYELLNLLESKHVVSEDEVRCIMENANGRKSRLAFDLLRVDDIDKTNDTRTR